MNVISIGTDRKILEEGSDVRKRMIEYGKLCNELHIIIFAKSSLGLETWRIADNVWVYPTNSFNKLLYMRDARSLADTIVKLRKFTPENTIVTSQDPFETGKVGLAIKQKYKYKFQVQLHTDPYSPFFATSFLNRIRVKWSRVILPQADEIRVVSKRIKESIVKELPIPEQKIDVLPIFTDKEQFSKPVAFDLKKKYPQFTFTLLMISRLAPEKNLPFALEVFAEIVKKYPHTGLIIVGDGGELSILKKKVESLGIKDHVMFEGWQNDLVSYYKTASLFLHTSAYEGYGLVLLGAAYSGIPIVTSDVGIAGDILIDGKNACVCPVNDKNCFITKISRIVSDNAFRENIKEALLEEGDHGRMLSHQEYLDGYKALLEKTLQGS